MRSRDSIADLEMRNADCGLQIDVSNLQFILLNPKSEIRGPKLPLHHYSREKGGEANGRDQGGSG